MKKEYGKNRYHSMSEEKKQKLREYQNIIENQKNQKTISLFYSQTIIHP